MDGTMNDMGMDMSLQQMDMNTVMYPEITGEKAGPIVGKAYEFLLELRLENGPLGADRAKKELLNWWKKNQS